MIVKFALVNALSLTGTYQFFCLINCIFAVPILPNAKYFIDKLFYPKQWSTFHAICTQCRQYAGTFEPRKNRYIRCKMCQTEINVKNYDFKDFFVTMDASKPISELIEAHSNHFNFVMSQRIYKPGFINDIYYGQLYRKFVESLSESDRHQYATITFNTDGAPLFESSTCSIWLIQLMVNKLPYNVRTKELILAGLWFGKDKPNMKVFLAPFVESMNILSIKGVQCNINGIEQCIKIFPLVCCVDAVARAPVQGFSQFNAHHSCGQCLHPGEWVRSSNKMRSSGCIKYPLLNTVPKRRNVASTMNHAEKAEIERKPIFGVKSKSPLLDLIKFNCILGCVVDSMHLISGIAKQFSKMWFGPKGKVGLLPRRVIPEIDMLLTNIKSPHQIARLTRSLSDREFWKAREWENWVLYYSMPILLNVLPLPHLMHWALFAEALYILSKDEISIFEVDVADKLLHKFVTETEKLYGKAAMTFNVHSLLHLARSVYNWGPIWAHSTFAFEAGNGQLLKGIHSAKGIHHQVCRRISLQYSLTMLKKRVTPSFSVQQFCNYTCSSMVKKTLQVSKTRYFSPTSTINRSWIENLNLSSESSVSYRKMVKNGCLFLSSTKSNKRSDNAYVTLDNNTYVKVNDFIVDRSMGKEYTVVQKLVTTNAFGNDYKMLQKIISINDVESAIPTTTIAKVCVHISLRNDEYICAVPNLYSY